MLGKFVCLMGIYFVIELLHSNGSIQKKCIKFQLLKTIMKTLGWLTYKMIFMKICKIIGKKKLIKNQSDKTFKRREWNVKLIIFFSTYGAWFQG